MARRRGRSRGIESPRNSRNWSSAISSAPTPGTPRERTVREEMRSLRRRGTAADAGAGKAPAQAAPRGLADRRRFEEPEALAQVQGLLPHHELRQRAGACREYRGSSSGPKRRIYLLPAHLLAALHR